MDAQTATATPAADQSSNGVNNWGKEEDLGNSIGFEDVDREQAKQGKVTISGNGSAFTVQNNNTDSKDDNSKAQDVKDNFLSKIVHISLWKILFWVISGISVAAIAAVVYYIVMIKRQAQKKPQASWNYCSRSRCFCRWMDASFDGCIGIIFWCIQ